ncbi:Ig-like domain-containing protein [Rhodohalobacter sp. SW132]|uniref:Ig-like domain-containing protein n=1 Tax=Rhodohalobacter sp. SW132 TaxID=2293433 RepID=UPI001314C95A|nr:Ig-like domain-containing protein [Rhodohalobacter sp. SW132]
MRRLLFLLASVIAVFTFSCDTTQPSFDDSVPGVFELSTNVSPDDGGTIEPSEGEYVSGTTLEISAIPETGYVFERWEGDLTGSINPTFLTMSRNRTVTAFFIEADYPLTIEIVGQGRVFEEIISQTTKAPQSAETGDLSAPASRDSLDDDPDLKNNRDSEEQLKLQRDTGGSPDQQVDNDVSNLDISSGAPGSLQQGIQRTTEQLTAESSASASIEIETVTVQLTADPDDGWRFARWEGDLTGSQNPDSLLVDEEKNVIAVFEEIGAEEYTLNLDVEGQGFIEASPDRTLYDEGEEVTLTAVPDDGWRFLAWQGDLEGSENPETLIMDADKNVTSVFSRIGAPVSEILQQPSSVTAGENISPAPAVRITNDQGEPLEGIGVSASLNNNGFSSSSGTDVNTNSDGVARFDNLSIESVSTGYRIIFEADDPDISSVSSSEFEVSPAEADPASTVANVRGGVAGGSTEITISVFDRFNNPIANAEDEISVTVSGANSASPSVSAGDEIGQYIAIYSPENAGTDEVTIELNGTPIDGSPFISEVFTSDISASESSVSADPTELQAGSSSTVTIQLRDESGNPISELFGSDFSINVSGNSTAGSVSEVSSGTYQFSVSNTTAQQISVTVFAGGVRLSDTPEITFIPSDPDMIAVPSGSQPGTSTAGEVISNSPSARVTDEFGNNIAGLDVTVSEQNGQDFSSGTETKSTNSSGIAVFDDLVITNAGRYNLVYTAGSLTTTSNAFDVNPAAASASETTADVPNGSAGDRTDITITVRDEFGNRVEGVAENLSVSVSGDNSGATLESVAEEGNGVYTTAYTPTATGTDQITIELNGTGISGSPYDSNIITSDADAVEIEQQPQQTVAGESVAGPPSVIVTDDLGNPVEGVEVVASVQGSASFDGGSTTQNTGSNGIAVFNDLVIETAGNYTLSFNAIGASENAVSESFDVVAADPDNLSRLSGNNQNGVVTETLDEPFVVRVADEFGNPVSGLEVEFSIGDTPSGASGQSLSSSSVTTNSAGEASSTLTLGNLTGTYTVIAAAGAAGNISFSANAAAGSAETFDFDDISSPQTAGESFDISLTAFDGQGNIATGYQGTASLSASAGSVSPGNAEFTNGTASLSVSLSTASGNQSITASDGSITGSSNTFEVQSGGVSASNSSVSADPNQLQAGNSSELSINLRDGSNNPVTGLSSSISIDVSGNGSAGGVSETGSGNYTADVSNTTAEIVSVTVSVNGVTLDDESSIEFTAADPDELTIVSGNNQSAAVSQQLSDDFVIIVTDEFDNPVPNTTVNFSIENTPSGASGQSLSSSSAQTNSSGQTSTRLTLGDIPGEYTVNASVSGAGSVTFSAEAEIGAASDMEIATQPGTTTAGQSISPSPQVRITDGAGNTIEGVSVTVSVEGGESFDSGTTTQSTNSSGIATFSNLVLETSGSYSLVFNAAASGVSNVTSDSFEIEPAAGDPSNSSADVPNGAAGDATSITITVLDEFGNPVTGAAGNLSVSVSGANSGASFISIEDNGDGTYSTSYTPQNNGTDTITIELSGSGISGSPFTSEVSTSEVSASSSSVSADPTELQAGNSSTVTVQLKDGADNSIAGLSDSDFNISVSGNGSAGSVSETSGGTYVFEVTNETAQQVTVTVTATGTTLNDTPLITYTAADPDVMQITTEPGESVAGQPISGPPAVRIWDEFDNPVPGVSVSVSEQDGQAFTAGSDTSVETNGNGFAVFSNIAIGQVGDGYNLVFSSSGVTPRTSNAFDVTAASADASSTTANVPDGTAGSSTPIEITVEDGLGNRVEGVEGDLSVTIGGANDGASVATISDDGNGEYSTSYTPENAGTDEVAITLGGNPISGSPYSSEVSAADPSNVEIESGNNQTGSVSQELSEDFVVRVTDTFDNPVPNATVNFSIDETPSGATVQELSNSSAQTNNSGLAATRLTLGDSPGEYRVDATVSGAGSVTFSAEAEIGAASEMEITTQPGTTTAGQSISPAPQVRITDSAGNEIEGISVTVSVQNGGGFDSGTTTQSTNSSGVATFSNLVLETAGSYSLVFDADASGVPNVTSDSFEIEAAAGDPSSSSADVPDGEAGSSTPIEITVEDSFGNRVEGVAAGLSVTISGANDGASVAAISDNGNGEYSTSYTPENAGTDQVAITLGGDPISESPFSSEVSGGSASSFNFEPIGTQTAGVPFEITITAEDANGNTDSGYNQNVSLETTAGTITPETANFSTGTVTLDVEVSEAGSNQTITADDGSFSSTSNEFTVESGGIDTDNSSVIADPSELQVGNSSTLTIELRDGSNNPVSGFTNTDFTIGVTGDAEAGAVSENGTSGNYTTAITNETAETVTVSVTAEGTSVGEADINFTPADPSNIIIESGNEQTGSVSQELDNDFVVTVTDEYGNAVRDESVSFSITDTPDGSSGESLSTELETTNNSGEASTRLTLGDTPGTYSVEATFSGAGSVTFTATAEAGEASNLDIITEPAQTTAGEAIRGSPDAPLTVRVIDTDGIGISGVNVTVQIEGGNTFDGGETGQVTDTSGEASFPDLVIETAGTNYRLIFSADGVDSKTSSPFDVVAAEASVIEAEGVITSAAADGDDELEFSINVLDEFSNQVPGVTVNASDNGTNITYTRAGSSQETDDSGQVTFTATSETIQSDVIFTFTELVNSNTTTAQGSFVDNSGFTLDNPGEQTAGEEFILEITDARGVGGELLSDNRNVSVESNQEGLIYDESTNFNNGSADIPITLTTEDEHVLIVNVDGISDDESVSLNVVSGGPATVNVNVLNGTATADGVDELVFEITVEDINDNPVPNVTVEVSHEGSGIIYTGAGSSDVTDDSGQVTFTATSETIQSDVNFTFTESVNNISDTAQGSFEAGSPSASNSGIEAAPTEGLTADGSDASIITITVRDGGSNELEGEDVFFAITGGDGSLSSGSWTTDEFGQASAELTSTQANTVTVTGYLGTNNSGEVIGTVDVEFESVAADAGQSEISAEPTSIAADGSSTSIVTVELKGANGNPISSGGDNVELTTTAGTLLNSVIDNADGTYSQDLQSSTTAETATVTGTLDGDVIGTVDVEFETLQASQISSLTIDEAEIPVDGSTSVTAIVLDAIDNPVQSVEVSFFSNESNRATVDESSALTDENGLATVGISGAADETGLVIITASIEDSDANVAFSDSETVELTVVAGSASSSNSGIEASPSAGLNADGSDASELTITVRDVGGNELEGEDVFFEITNGDGTLTSGPWTTNTSGQAIAELTSTQANTVTVMGYLGTNESGEEIGTAEIEFEAEASSQMSIIQQPENTTAGEVITPLPQVLIVSGDGDPLGEISVTVSVEERVSFSDGTLTQLTESSGVATFDDLVITSAGNHRLVFSADGISSVTSEPFIVNPGVGNPSNTTAEVNDGIVNTETTITIMVRDDYGNLVGGAASELFVEISMNNSSIAEVIETDSLGQYTARYSPANTGEDSIDITLNNEQINGSIFSSLVTTSEE